MQDTRSPCAADALFGLKTITVNGKPVGIARFCDAIANVRALNLSGDDEIRAALIREVEKNNFIPRAVRDDYAGALLSEYRAACTGPCHAREK
jgi:hypothetical protein